MTSATTPINSGMTGASKQIILHYLEQINFMKNDDRTTLLVDYDHVFKHDLELAQVLIEHYYRFEQELRKGLTEVIRKYHPAYELDAEKRQHDFWLAFYNLPVIYK
jgi:DNA replicative helicase MCM subunit Mcm2 (Cdc46/Mcm family)